MNTFEELYKIIEQRKGNVEPNSYTCYLFEKGLDKILKKCGEECSEMIIAAKNNDNNELKEEICDFLYHMTVLMVEKGISTEEISEILKRRMDKMGNLKTSYNVDKDS